jgi:hypothetical protein
MELARKVTLKRWERKPDGGHHYAYVPAFVELEIDIDALLQLVGNKALSNRSGKTRYMSGLIKAEARRIVESDDAVA